MKMKSESIGTLEVRVRFNQGRADRLKAEADLVAAKIEALRVRFDALQERAQHFNEIAAGQRGIISIMRKKGYSWCSTTPDGFCKFE